MNAPTSSVIKRLCACSMNRCAFTGCDVLVTEKSGTFTGEFCHIKAASERGPRYDSSQTEDERHAYNNMILLCRRHHKIIDTEVETYTVEVLQDMKRKHEQQAGVVKISPAVIALATAMLEKYVAEQSHHRGLKIAIASPGAIQADQVVLKTTKSRIVIAPPPDSIGGDLQMRNYVQYLILRYNDYQKGDSFKTDRFKYMAIYKAIEREFGAKWELVPVTRGTALIEFLKGRIDRTVIGRKNKTRGHANYHGYEVHPHG